MPLPPSRRATRQGRSPWVMAATIAFGLALIAGVSLNRLSLGVLVGALLVVAVAATWLERRLRGPRRRRGSAAAQAKRALNAESVLDAGRQRQSGEASRGEGRRT